MAIPPHTATWHIRSDESGSFAVAFSSAMLRGERTCATCRYREGYTLLAGPMPEAISTREDLLVAIGTERRWWDVFVAAVTALRIE